MSKQDSKIRRLVREALRDILSEDDDYQTFVKGVMDTIGIDSPQDLTEEGRKKFFNLLGQNYDEDTDEADDVPMGELADKMEPSDFKGEAPDFLKQEEQVREAARKIVRNMLS